VARPGACNSPSPAAPVSSSVSASPAASSLAARSWFPSPPRQSKQSPRAQAHGWVPLALGDAPSSLPRCRWCSPGSAPSSQRGCLWGSEPGRCLLSPAKLGACRQHRGSGLLVLGAVCRDGIVPGPKFCRSSARGHGCRETMVWEKRAAPHAVPAPREGVAPTRLLPRSISQSGQDPLRCPSCSLYLHRITQNNLSCSGVEYY